MISIVICSINPAYLDAIKKNIELSIGIPYEIIVIDNNLEKKSISAAYNKGAKEAKYELVCFLHEDILFKVNNWGQTIITAFAEKEVGLLGIAGSYYYSLAPISWFNTNEKEENFIQTPRSFNTISKHIQNTKFPDSETTEVVAIDGLFMVTRTELLKNFSFDEVLLNGFHGYDVDFSLQILQHHKIFVSKKILVEHISNTSLNQAWFDAICKISKKWKNKLPAYTTIYTKSEIEKLNQESTWDFYFISAGYLPRRKRMRLYLYYAIKSGILLNAIKRITKHYYQRLFLNK